MATTKSPRPKTDVSRAVQLGVEAHTLVRADREALEPRLTPSLIDGLTADLTALGLLGPGTVQKRAERSASTLRQEEAAGRVAAIVAAMRGSVRAADLGAASRKSWGVGNKLESRVVGKVIAAGELALARGTSAPDEARAAGILPSDLDSLRAALTALRGADTSQEQSKVDAKQATRARNQAHRRIEDAVKRIAAAGALHFAGTERATAYAALAASPARRKRDPQPT
jgi:hypothetical protein